MGIGAGFGIWDLRGPLARNDAPRGGAGRAAGVGGFPELVSEVLGETSISLVSSPPVRDLRRWGCLPCAARR